MPRMTRRHSAMISCYALLAAVVTTAGCGTKEPGNRPKRVPASGIVQLDGTPDAGATVVFKPTDPAGKPAFGKSDANGKFQLTTFDTNDGVIPGTYRVSIMKEEDIKLNPGKGEDEPGYNPDVLVTPPKNLYPEIYSDDQKSQIEFIIDEKGSENLVIEIDSKRK